MIKKIIAGVVIIIIVAIAYLAGRSAGADSVSRSRMKRDVMVHEELVTLEKTFLTNVVARPSTMISGHYVQETKLAARPAAAFGVEIEFTNGRLTKISGNVQQVVQTGNIVSWEQYDMNEGPSAIFVGVIDGDAMWGRVFVEPGQGWKEGVPPEYGVWTIRRAAYPGSADIRAKNDRTPTAVGDGDTRAGAELQTRHTRTAV